LPSNSFADLVECPQEFLKSLAAELAGDLLIQILQRSIQGLEQCQAIIRDSRGNDAAVGFAAATARQPVPKLGSARSLSPTISR